MWGYFCGGTKKIPPHLTTTPATSREPILERILIKSPAIIRMPEESIRMPEESIRMPEESIRMPEKSIRMPVSEIVFVRLIFRGNMCLDASNINHEDWQSREVFPKVLKGSERRPNNVNVSNPISI
jgi:hypothetical protein